MKTPTVYIATLKDRVRMALHPMDDRDGQRWSGPEIEPFPFPVVWGFPDLGGWMTSCMSSTAPRSTAERLRYGQAKPGYGGRVFTSDADAIAWLLEGEAKRG